MPFSYESYRAQGQLHQGEVLFGIQEFQPEHTGERMTPDNINLLGEVADRQVIIVTPECDLLSDYLARREVETGGAEESEVEGKLLPHVHVCEVFEETDIKELLPKGTEFWKLVRTNQNIRYHAIPRASIGNHDGEYNPALYLDFKRMFSMSTKFIYASLLCEGVERRGVMPSPWVDSVIDSLFHFQGRVCVPDPDDRRPLLSME